MELIIFVVFLAVAGGGIFYMKKRRADKKAFLKMTVEEVKAPDPEA